MARALAFAVELATIVALIAAIVFGGLY